LEIDPKQFCSKCVDGSLVNARAKAEEERPILMDKIAKAIERMPATSIDIPPGWDFQPIGIVTSQATMGTGVITEIVSNWTDFFGAQSKRHNDKLKQGEDFCFAKIRSECIEQGGNGIVGIDIDYAEVGGLKAMLMVCITGTAVRIKNIESLYPDAHIALQCIDPLKERLSILEGF
jgi:uncharacterized protein YbjQ (UPF0145 family)